MAIELELAKYLEEEEVDMLINQFPVTAEYDGIGSKGTKFVFYIPRVLLKGIYRGKTESLSVSEMTCIAVSVAWCVVCQGVV